MLELHVREAEGGNLLLAPRDGRPRRVEAEESAFRKDVRHRDEIAPVPAAQLEHAAALGRSGREPVQRRHRREAVRVGLRERRPGIRDRVVNGRLSS